jgi:hypothetical protein
MYLVVIAWLYIAVMMAAAEATNPNGTVVGAIVTFFLYGIGPLALVVYLMATPARRKKRRFEEQQEAARLQAAASDAEKTSNKSVPPNAGSHAPGGSEG